MASGVGGTTGENKKGEVNELKASLRNPAIDRDPEKKREVIKRVIAYMTLGIDVSKLFSEMIMVRLALPAVACALPAERVRRALPHSDRRRTLPGPRASPLRCVCSLGQGTATEPRSSLSPGQSSSRSRAQTHNKTKIIT